MFKSSIFESGLQTDPFFDRVPESGSFGISAESPRVAWLAVLYPAGNAVADTDAKIFVGF